MTKPQITAAIKTINEALDAAEKAAKELADNFPSDGAVQALRGRCLAAKDLAEFITVHPPEENAAPAAV